MNPDSVHSAIDTLKVLGVPDRDLAMYTSVSLKQPAMNLKFRRLCVGLGYESQDAAHELWMLCARDPLFFLNTFAYLLETRDKQDWNTSDGYGTSKVIPFITRGYQDKLVLDTIKYLGRQDIVIPKSRETGISWMIGGALAAWDWNFHEQTHIGFVSKDLLSANNPDDPDALFSKFEFLLKRLPFWLLSPSDYERNITKNTFKNLKNNSSLTAYAAKADIGRGGRKAQSLTSRILTPAGWTTMGELHVGQAIMGRDGTPQFVMAIHPQGELELFEVEFSDGSKTECCDDHLWAVRDAKDRKHRGSISEKPFVVKTLREIRQSLLIQRTDGQTQYRYQIPVASPMEFPQLSPLPVHPYVIGCMLGDGSLTRNDPTFTCDDPEMIETLTPMLAEIGSEFAIRGKRGIEYSIRDIRPRTQGVGLFNKHLVALGMAGQRAETKSIPVMYKFASIWDRLELLRGLLDTDGWISLRVRKRESCRVRFCSVSKQLADDVKSLVETVGGVATITSKLPTFMYHGEKKTGQVAYELTITLPDFVNPFKLSRKADKWRPRSTYQARRTIVAVRPIGTKPAQCITVSNQDNLYVTDHCIVTHNSWMLMDEFHFFEQGDDYAALDSTVHVTPCRVFVSTANRDRGMSGAFYDVVSESATKNGVMLVIDWKDDPDKRRGLYHGEVIPGTDTYKLVIDDTDFWNEFANDDGTTYRHPLLKDQNYPFILDERIRSLYYDHVWNRPGSTPQSVAAELDRNFGGATAQIFNPQLLQRAIAAVKPVKIGGDILRNPEKPSEWMFMPLAVGGLTNLWISLDDNGNPPKGEYVFGADISAGTGGEWSSYSALEGLDKVTGEQVFEWRGNRLDPIQFAELSVWVCNWFHGAYLVPECNGPLGQLFINKTTLELKYGNVFRRIKKNVAYREKTELVGYNNTDGGIELLKNMEAQIRQNRVHPNSLIALNECSRYFLKGGKLVHSAAESTEDGAGMGKAHGDAAIALGCASFAIDDIPVTPDEEVKSEAPYQSFLWRRQQFEKMLQQRQNRSYWESE